jgi:hypothetical protein
MAPIDLHLGPLAVLAIVGLIAIAGGAIWFVVFLIEHVRFV